MKILITGSNGLLGQKLVKQCLKNGYDFLATSKGENRFSTCPVERYQSLDITSLIDIEKVFQAYVPTHVIHTAAITNVDYCEDHVEECNEVNVKATKLLWEASKKRRIHLQLLSTDFVFDGEKGNYKEEDEVNPLSIYAQSKVNGENLLVNDESSNWSVVRTIIVYGEGENLSRSNIILWSKKALKEGQEIKIVDDQFRAPTWADDLAWACLEIVKQNKMGIYHIAGPETMSILQIVERVAKHYGLSTDQLSASKSNQLNQAAKRPPKTGFKLDKARREINYHPKTLEQTLDLIQD
jgi:dTDP-4-dehydrorhamnose reductase